MVPFDMEEYEKRYRPVKKTLSIPGWLNDAADLHTSTFPASFRMR